MKLAHFFLDIDMRCSHDGLVDMVKKKKIKIVEDEFIVFMNRKRTMVKMFCGDKHALMHYKGERVLDAAIIQYLPRFCGGREMDIQGALRELVIDKLKRRGGNVSIS